PRGRPHAASGLRAVADGRCAAAACRPIQVSGGWRAYFGHSIVAADSSPLQPAKQPRSAVGRLNTHWNPAMRKARILIVDDSTVIRRLLSDALSQDASIEVAGTAANGRIALAKIPQINPDLVILDLEMPELDGLATLPEIRKSHPRLPV